MTEGPLLISEEYLLNSTVKCCRYRVDGDLFLMERTESNLRVSVGSVFMNIEKRDKLTEGAQTTKQEVVCQSCSLRQLLYEGDRARVPSKLIHQATG